VSLADIFRGRIRAASMSGDRVMNCGRFAVLTYHSLDNSGSVISTPPAIFAEQMKILHDSGVEVISLHDVRQLLNSSSGCHHKVSITFDDGYRNVLEHGLPILQQYGFSATVFLVTDHCGETDNWPGQPPFPGRNPILSWSDIKKMSSAGIIFGSHTCSHPDLRTLSKEELTRELLLSKQRIEHVIHRPVEIFAYPFGAYDETVIRFAKAHYEMACSTRLDFAGQGSDPFVLERIDMYYLKQLCLFRQLFSKKVELYLDYRRWLRGLRNTLKDL